MTLPIWRNSLNIPPENIKFCRFLDKNTGHFFAGINYFGIFVGRYHEKY